jgi:SAM-dependent methyltransferase
MADSDERKRSLDEIRTTYAGYERNGRSSLWDRDNPGYRRLGERRDADLLELIRQSLIGDRSELLDVGCGTGGVAAIPGLRDLSVEVTGLDLLPDRLAIARERAPDATFVLGSADDMPFKASAFGLATAVTLFSSLSTLALELAVAREVDRVLRPGGWLIWYDIRYSNPSNSGVHGIPGKRLWELFPGWNSHTRSHTLIPPIARRLGRATPFLYPPLEAIPPFRSHLIGRLQKPA